MSLRELLGQSVDIVEVAVGFVLLLPIELGLIEGLVIEGCGLVLRLAVDLRRPGDSGRHRGSHALRYLASVHCSGSMRTDAFITVRIKQI